MKDSAGSWKHFAAQLTRYEEHSQPGIGNLELNRPASGGLVGLTSELEALQVKVRRELFGCPDLWHVLQLALERRDRCALPMTTEQAPLLRCCLAAYQRHRRGNEDGTDGGQGHRARLENLRTNV